MDSQQESQSKRPRGKGKDKQPRRLWTVKEEEALLRCMLDELAHGTWRAENGFKSGFFGAIEKAMQKVLPGTTIKAQPNIESKVKNWKEKYGVIADMRNLSGFSWNHATQCIVVDSDQVWEEYEKFHPKAKGMNGKPFPMYESWQIIFGKDRATGELAEDPDDIGEEIDIDDISIGTTPTECYTPKFANGDYVHGSSSFQDLGQGSEAGTPTSNGNTTNANTTIGNPPPKKAKKLSRAEAKQAALNDAFGNYMTDTTNVLEKLVDAIAHDSKLSDKREKVFGELMKLNLDMVDRFIANAMILEAEEKVDGFYGIPQ